MTANEWYTAYLLRFGLQTITTIELQDGEREFLQDMGADIRSENPRNIDNAWLILKEQHNLELRRKEREDFNTRHDETL